MNNKKNKWTEQEIDLIVCRYPVMKASCLQDLLPRHSLNAIYCKARELMLRAYAHHEEEQKVILKMKSEMSVHQIAREYGYSERTIYRRCNNDMHLSNF